MTGLLSNLEADVTVLSYRISGEEHQLKQHTSTGARKGHIKAVLKHDSEENHSQVYSELVANRLAQFLGLPVAVGVAISDADNQSITRFASLWVEDITANVFDFTSEVPPQYQPPEPNKKNGVHRDFYWQYKRLCSLHPIEAAQLAVFDLWVGNEDRELNLKGRVDGEVGGNELNVFFSLDQGDSLLSCGGSKEDSLKKLQSPSFPSFSPMSSFLNPFECGLMTERIKSIPDWALMSAVVCGVQVGSVTPDMQYMLLDVLDKRREVLCQLVERVLLTPA